MAVSTAPIGVAPLRMSKIAAAPPQTIGEPGLRKLVDGDACQTFRGVLCDRAQHGDRGCRTRQRNGHDLGGNACTGQCDQIAGAEITPDQRRRGTHVKDGARLFASCIRAAGEERQHVDHFLHGLVRERAGDDWLFGIQQCEIQAVGVLDVLRHFMANDSRGLGVVLRESALQP